METHEWAEGQKWEAPLHHPGHSYSLEGYSLSPFSLLSWTSQETKNCCFQIFLLLIPKSIPNSHAQLLSHVKLFVTPWTVACQVPLFMEFFRQEYWSGLPFPPSGDLPNPGIEPVSLVSPALAGGCFTTEPTEKHSLTTAREISSIPVAVSLPDLNCSHGWPPPAESSPSYYSRADKNSPGVIPIHSCHLGLGSDARVRKHITVV